MKAMILAAGLGTRLGILTAKQPKALIELNGQTLLEIALKKLAAYGFNDIIINIHHFSEQIKDYLETHQNFGLHIELSDESKQLLDTGGGIKKAAWFFNDGKPFLVHNVDIISTVDLKHLYAAHIASGAMSTLCCTSRRSSRYFLFDSENRLCGWQNTKTGEERITRTTNQSLKPMAFSGIHVIDPKLTAMMPPIAVFSIVEAYLRLSPQNIIKCFDAGNAEVTDAGKPEELIRLQQKPLRNT